MPSDDALDLVPDLVPADGYRTPVYVSDARCLMVWATSEEGVEQIAAIDGFAGQFRGIRVGDELRKLDRVGTIIENDYGDLLLAEVPGVAFDYDDPESGDHIDEDGDSCDAREDYLRQVVTAIVVFDPRADRPSVEPRSQS